MPEPRWTTGYCTNVHAGTDLASIRENLSQYAIAVREQVVAAGDQPMGAGLPMGVGLWVPAEAAHQLTDRSAAEEFAQWLAEAKLLPFTFNGFPYGNFHQAVVKHKVYEPAWWQPERRQYTSELIGILDALLPPGRIGSISTLPLGWGTSGWGTASGDELNAAAANLGSIAEELRRLEDRTGRRIVLAIEPEPGCCLDTSADVVQFFDRYFPKPESRRYLTVCHDICHAEVMYESQADVLRRYAEYGIVVGKVQVSSAIDVRWAEMDSEARQAAVEQLSRFAEDRYLHQTGRLLGNGSRRWVDDLPQWLDQLSRDPSLAAGDRSWRVHFHVPIYLEQFGRLHATREAIGECLRAWTRMPSELRTDHLEVETYAWGVLPAELQHSGLADSIATEMQWLHQTLAEIEAEGTGF
ncbi:metabolite traffic protein EboE [Candidatus Laterigemmans baculatus]|uniref:metabolite traffic protein EboE n=1 Tax=Candidatus Laterigemmans baculatus TaxID=2770505 RepID=UPI0013DD06D2|nr:metabolite traffic protein EboE [Candidatus Laterigemmans baculatus]